MRFKGAISTRPRLERFDYEYEFGDNWIHNLRPEPLWMSGDRVLLAGNDVLSGTVSNLGVQGPQCNNRGGELADRMATEEMPMEFIVWLKPASLAKLSPWKKSQIRSLCEGNRIRGDRTFPSRG